MNTDATEFLGTCPACFSQHVVRKGVMIKHGWQEVGGREVGVYGKAYHSGECFGVGLVPFETSCEGTKSFLADVAVPNLRHCREVRAHLQTRPVLTVGVTEYAKDEHGHIVYRNRRAVTKTVAHPCSETNEFGSKKDYNGVSRYERELTNAMAQADAALVRASAHVDFLREKIATWAPAELPVYTGKVATVHYVSPKADARRPRTFCGSDSRGIRSTSTEADATCTRCLKALSVAAKDKAEREQVLADTQAVVEFLRGRSEPATSKDIRVALGFDTKRVNKVLNRLNTDIVTEYGGKTTTYRV